MIRGIHHIALHAADLDRMVAFYGAAFGFVPASDIFAWRDSRDIDRALGVRGSAARSQMLRAGNMHLELFEYASPPPERTEPLRPSDLGYTHFAVDVTGIESEMDRLRALGMRFAAAGPLHGDGIKAIYGYDPEGNVIELQELAGDHVLAGAWPDAATAGSG